MLFLLLTALGSQSAHARLAANDVLAGDTWLAVDITTPGNELPSQSINSATGNSLELVLHVNGVAMPLSLNTSHVDATTAFKIARRNSEASLDDTAIIRPQLYTGHITDEPESWVRLARQANGGFTGRIKAYGHYYELQADTEPVSNDTDTDTAAFAATRMRKLPPLAEQLSELSQNHDYLVYPPQARPTPIGSETGSETGSEFPDQNRMSLQQLRFEDGIDVPGALRIAIVVDSRFDDFHEGRGISRALSVINIVDGIYQEQFGVALVLDSVVAYTDPATDPMRGLGGTVESILDSFREIKLQEQQLQNDLTMVHLFTGLEDPRGVLGLGWINTACRTDGYNISLSTPFAYDALLAAHEMAHNLGALHDDDPGCTTDRSNIMWPRLSSQTAPVFSQCSINAARPGLAASCNLDNVDLAIGMQSRTGPDGNGRALLTFVSNRDPARVAEKVRSLTRLPAGSRVMDAPPECTVSQLPQSVGPEVVCELGDIDPLVNRTITLTLGLSTEPGPQSARVDVASLVAADSQMANNSTQLDLRALGSIAGGQPLSDDESVTVASASSELMPTPTTEQTVPGSQTTQLVMPDGTTMVIDGPQNSPTGVSGGAGKVGYPALLLLLVVTTLRCFRDRPGKAWHKP